MVWYTPPLSPIVDQVTASGNDGEDHKVLFSQAVGMTGKKIQEMYRLLAITKYDDRYVIPTASPETPRGITSLDPFGDADPTKTMIPRDDLGMGAPSTCSSEGGCGCGDEPADADGKAGTVSLLSWGPGERPDSMFPGGGGDR